ncbi:HET-domain-containing protein, partial [Setomelanomma holmii]
WVKHCDDHDRSTCQPVPIASLQDLKVIDCSSHIVVSAPAKCEFAALSYVWGDIPFISGGKKPDLLDLPRTIEDAITMTNALGYQYLSVDRYSVDQGDPEDVHRQVSQMGFIYAAVKVTLIASSGVNPTHGLPGLRPGIRQPYSFRYERVGRNHLVALPGHSTMDIRRSAWWRRAWTFQECYMSKRRVFFTDRQALFVC